MKTYACDQCHTEIKPPVCAKCNAEMAHKAIDKNGKKIQVAECPKCQDAIKSPQCCGNDMKCK